MSEQEVTVEQFLEDVCGILREVTPTNRVMIGDEAVLIHPKDLHFLDKCVGVLDDLPVGIESLIDDED